MVHGGADNGEEEEFNNNSSGRTETPVVLKILNQDHDQLSLVSFVIFGLHSNINLSICLSTYNFSFLELY